MTEVQRRAGANGNGSSVDVNSPEFKTAVAEALAKATPGIASAVLAEVSRSMPTSAVLDDAVFDKLAFAITNLQASNSGKKIVPPDVLAARERAHKDLIARLRQVRERGEKPEYFLIDKIYIKEQIVDPFKRMPDKSIQRTEIVWTGVPNEAMRPLNQVAKEIYGHYKQWIGSVDKIHMQDKRPWWITGNNMIVKGNGPQNLVLGPVPDDEPSAAPAGDFVGDDESDFKVKNFKDPNASEQHILGTVAPAARANKADPYSLGRVR